jgi:hypothetical protein
MPGPEISLSADEIRVAQREALRLGWGEGELRRLVPHEPPGPIPSLDMEKILRAAYEQRWHDQGGDGILSEIASVMAERACQITQRDTLRKELDDLHEELSVAHDLEEIREHVRFLLENLEGARWLKMARSYEALGRLVNREG